MKIIIIRHGEPDYSIDSLTEKGWREARLLAKRLADMKIDGLYTSPLGRARATASPTEEIRKEKAIILPWLKEFSGKIVSPHSGKQRIPWNLAPGVWGNEMSFYDREKWANTALIQTGNSAEIYEEMTKGVDAPDQQGYSHFRCVQIGDTSHLYAGDEPVSGAGLHPVFEY